MFGRKTYDIVGYAFNTEILCIDCTREVAKAHALEFGSATSWSNALMGGKRPKVKQPKAWTHGDYDDDVTSYTDTLIAEYNRNKRYRRSH